MAAILSNLRNAPSVEAQAEMTLTTWRVFRTAGDKDLLFGFHSGLTLRMTTPITGFEVAAALVTTSSGRRYTLSGPPTRNAEILAAMAVYALGHSVVCAEDVTGEFWSGDGGLH